MAQKRQKQEEVQSGEDSDFDPQEEVVGNWKKVDLPEIPVVTGEQDEEATIKFRSKIYRWRGEWKQRGVGQLKFLQNKQNNLIRCLVRAQKTHKVIVNHLLQKAQDIFCKLEPLKTSNNSWTWAAYDVSDEKPQTQKFCAKFTSKEDYQKFQEQFEKACEHNAKILAELKSKQQKQEAKQAEEKKQ